MPDTDADAGAAAGNGDPEADRGADGEAQSAADDTHTVDPRLLEILVCPLTKTPLRYESEAQELISDQAGLAFPIRSGVPIMLIDEARPLDPDGAAHGPTLVAGSRGPR